VVKNLNEIIKPSKGTEMLQRIEDTPKVEDIGTIDPSIKIEESVPEKPRSTKEDQYKSMVKNGVEVVDVKAIEKKKKKKVEGNRMGDRYHLGIPINKGEHKNFDKV